jgi:sugar lactone lactonase YvrE
MLRRISAIVFVVLLCLAFQPAAAQDGPPPMPGEVIVGDLGAPRALAFDADGNLFVAVAGTGGEVSAMMPGPEGVAEVGLGMTGKIIMVAPDGTVSDFIGALPSLASPMETLGVYRAIPNGDSVWVIFSGEGPGASGAFWANTIAQINRETMVTTRSINLSGFEAVTDPDGRGYDTNVTDLAWADDGTMYITDAGANALLSWTEEGGLAVEAAWGNDVPTSVEIADNGDIYIGFLGEALAPGAGRIEHWSAGELVETFAGLTTITDILLADDGTLYAVEMLNFTEEGPGPGRVISVTADGAESVAEGLITPFGIAQGPDGALYVTFGTIAFEPGMLGGVVRIDMGM